MSLPGSGFATAGRMPSTGRSAGTGKSIDRYDAVLHRLDAARSNAEAGKPLPSPDEIGLRPAAK